MRYYLSEEYDNASEDEKLAIKNGINKNEQAVEAALRDAIAEDNSDDIEIILPDRSMYALEWKRQFKSSKVSLDDYGQCVSEFFIIGTFFAFLGIMSIFISIGQAMIFAIVAVIFLHRSLMRFMDYLRVRKTYRGDTLISSHLAYVAKTGFALTEDALFTAQVRRNKKDHIEITRIPYSDIQAAVVNKTDFGFVAVVFDREGIWHELREPKSEKIKSAEALVALINERMKAAA